MTKHKQERNYGEEEEDKYFFIIHEDMQREEMKGLGGTDAKENCKW